MSVRTIWAAIARAVRGRPVTHEEQQAAQRSLARDAVVDAQYETRSARFTGMHI